MTVIPSRNKVGLWVEDLNGFPGGLAKIKQVTEPKISVLYFDPRHHTAQTLTDARAAGFVAGIYYDPSWDKLAGNYPEAKAEAKKVSDTIGAANDPKALNPTIVMLDVETHDTAWQRAFIAEYRRLRPNRWTSWTCEPRQTNVTVASDAIYAASIDLCVQVYEGDMTPTDPMREVDYWLAGYTPRASLMYDAGLGTTGITSGTLFTSSRLKALFT